MVSNGYCMYKSTEMIWILMTFHSWVISDFVHIFLEMKISVQLTSFIFMYIYFYIHTSHTHMPSYTPTYIHTYTHHYLGVSTLENILIKYRFFLYIKHKDKDIGIET